MRILSRLTAARAQLGALAVVLASLTSSTATANIPVTWTQVGYPFAARKIAACGPSLIFALNDDHSLYRGQNGADGQWQYLTTDTYLSGIACDGNVLVGMNNDGSIWRANFAGGHFVGALVGWTYLDGDGDALSIGGGPGVVTVIDKNQSLYTSTSDDVTSFPGQSWWPRGVAGDAARFSGFQAWSSFDPWGLKNNVARFLALNYDGSLYFNDGVVLDNPGTWRTFSSLPNGAVAAEIAVASPTKVYVLDTTWHLWTATTAPLPASVTFSIAANNTSKGDYVRGTITITQDGTYSESGYFQLNYPNAKSVGYTLDCNVDGLNLHTTGQSGINIWTPPTSNFSTSGSFPFLADEWSVIVAKFQASGNASCTLSADDLGGGGGSGGGSGGGQQVCVVAHGGKCTNYNDGSESSISNTLCADGCGATLAAAQQQATAKLQSAAGCLGSGWGCCEYQVNQDFSYCGG
jgi:hypothetical protein